MNGKESYERKIKKRYCKTKTQSIDCFYDQ